MYKNLKILSFPQSFGGNLGKYGSPTKTFGDDRACEGENDNK